MPDSRSIDYVGSADYTKLETKLKDLCEIISDLSSKVGASRELRYSEIDVEGEREAGRLQPDELYVPNHIIDTNIRREQSAYVQYITQSPRAVILDDHDDSTIDLAPLERDLTKKLRFDGWQLSQFANIDGFQANGYSVMEVVQDLDNPGEIGHESVQYGDFAFSTDTRDIQAVEMTARAYYFTKTRLLGLCGDGSRPEDWSREEVQKVIDKDPDSSPSDQAADGKERSLYKVFKNMFKVGGVVQVAWSCSSTCSNWLRQPRPLFIGRRKLLPQQSQVGGQQMISPQQSQMNGQAQSTEAYETRFPYILFPYLISENDTITQLKGRVFLDQDLQEAVSSLVSSTVTKARRSAGLYFAKDVSDPNDELLLQKNIFFRSGCLINSKVTSFELAAPDPGIFSAIQMLVVSNQNETSQVNFAANNRKDSRKTAEEIKTSQQTQQQLSTVQVVLFSIALTQMYRLMVDVIKSRVQTGLLQVNPAVKQLYDRKFSVKPSGDTDVLEKQETIQKMTGAWSIVSQSPAANLFLIDLLELMFPERAAKYIQAIQQAIQQQQSAQAQQQQQMMQIAMQMGAGIMHLAKHSEYFSEIGKIHALPQVEQASEQLEQIQKQIKQQPVNK